MPRKLPGFYWDEEKNRYFPLASRPKGEPGHVSVQAADYQPDRRPAASLPSREMSDGNPRKRKRVERGEGMWRATEQLRASSASTRRNRAIHDIMSSNIASTSRGCSYHVSNSSITSFCCNVDSPQDDGVCSIMIGDAQGWLHSLSGASENMIHATELNLASPISSVCSWGTRHVATSLGSPCKIVVRELQPSETWMILSLPEKTCHDVWTAHLRDRSLALGAAKRGLFLPDIDSGEGFQVLDTSSDVLAVHQENHLVYTGARNGSISRFDTRLNTRNRQGLLEHRFEQSTSSITHLSILHDWEMLISTIRGDLETHDLRFLRSAAPLMRFAGHVNSYSTHLGLAVDPAEDFVFAAGQDCRVRVWSLRTGTQVQPPSHLPPVSDPHSASYIFRRIFDEPVGSLQVTESDSGISLWAASAGELHQCFLGQRGEFPT